MSNQLSDNHLAFLPITALAQLIKEKKITSQQITKIYLNRIKRHNPNLNAVVIDMEKEALERAAMADEAVAKGSTLGKLHGVPITVKEAFNIKGYKTTVNFKQLKNHVADDDADVVKHLYKEGAVILGKTNVPTLLSDHQTHGPLYPRANNPFDLSRTTGGSTGGGSSAVAAGLTGAEIGSDIGGSVRIPAHFCGVYSLKPTFETVSGIGHVPPLPKAKGTFEKMGVFGPVSRSLEDLELLFDIIKKEEAELPKETDIKAMAFSNRQLSDYKIAWTDTMNGVKTGDTTISLLKALIDQLKGQVQDVEQVSPTMDYQKTEKNWANLFGYLLGQDMPWIIRQLSKLQFAYTAAFRPIGKMMAEGIVGKKPAILQTYMTQRRDDSDIFQRFFEEHSFLLSPVAVGSAFEHCKPGQFIDVEGRKVGYWDMCLPFNYLANVLGNPSLVIPLGKSKDNLPIGLQIIGPHHAEKQLIHFAKLISPFVQGYEKPEKFDDQHDA